MSAAAIVTIVLAGIAVAVIAAFLIVLALVLRQVSRRLGAITESFAAMPRRSQPVGPLLDRVNATLEGARMSLEDQLVARPPQGDNGSPGPDA